MTVFKTSAKAELGGLKVNASSDDLLSTGIRKIEVKILQDDDGDFNESSTGKKPSKKVTKSKNTKPSSKNINSSAAKSVLNYSTQKKTSSTNLPKSSSTQSMYSKSYSYSPVSPKRKEQKSPDMQQYNRLNFKKEHLGIHKPTTHRYNSKYMRNKYNQNPTDQWETQSAITPILEDPNMPFGPNLYKQMKDNLKPFCPKLKFVKKEIVPPVALNKNNNNRSTATSSVSSNSTYKNNPHRTRQLSSNFTSSMLSDSIFEKDERDDDECSVTINVLDGKTVRIKNSDNQYLTGYQRSDHINPKYRFTDRLDSDSDQLFHIEHVNGNACVLVSVMKHIGYIKPALFYSPLTKDLQLRDYFPYCPKERKYFVNGNSGQGQNFLFDCNNYHIELPGFGMTDLEIVCE